MMARMYDVASGLAYERMRRRARLAMSVGGENRVGRIGPGAIRRYHGMGDPALEAVLHLACTDVGMESVGACCHIANRASARVMEKVGMKQTSRGECSGMYPNAGGQPEESFFYTWTPPER